MVHQTLAWMRNEPRWMTGRLALTRADQRCAVLPRYTEIAAFRPSTICTTQTAAECHTAFMAFYEEFWVVAGTAAPVIALAAVVSAGSADEQVDRMAEAGVRLAVASHKSHDDPDLLKALEEMGTGNLLTIAKAQYVNVVLQAPIAGHIARQH